VGGSLWGVHTRDFGVNVVVEFLILGKFFGHITKHVESWTTRSSILKVLRLLTASFCTCVSWHQVQVHTKESIFQRCLIDGLLMSFHSQSRSEQLGFCVGSTHNYCHNGRQHVKKNGGKMVEM